MLFYITIIYIIIEFTTLGLFIIIGISLPNFNIISFYFLKRIIRNFRLYIISI